jgi:anti-sigma B factor antagonist
MVDHSSRPSRPQRPVRPPNSQAYELILPRDRSGTLVIEPLEPRLTDGEVVSRFETELQKVVEATGSSRVVIDFKNVKFLSSAVLGVIVGLGILIRDSGGNLALASVAPNLHKVFTITSLDKMIRIFGTTDEAIAALS